MTTPIMNLDALGEIVSECNTWQATCAGDAEAWHMGFNAAMQRIEQYGRPIAEACEADYGDAEGPVMNPDALSHLVAACDGEYNDNRNTGNHGSGEQGNLWLLGFSAGIQRLEMYGGDIVADCT